MMTLADLQGRWQLTRVIEDARAGLTGHLEGVSLWTPDAAGLRQEESGWLRYGGAAPMRAERAYLWRAAGDGLAVFFDDGRPFHRLGPGRMDDRHLCDPDIYDVSYDLSDWPRWRTVWRVQGPRKDMVISSRFAPAEAGVT